MSALFASPSGHAALIILREEFQLIRRTCGRFRIGVPKVDAHAISVERHFDDNRATVHP